MTNEVKMVFDSATTVISLAAALGNAANTYSGLTGLTMVDLDNSTLLYPKARAVLGLPDTLAAAPSAGATVDLYMTQVAVDGASDETPVPVSSDITSRARYVGSFMVDDADVAYIKPIVIDLEGVQKAKFYILNNTGQTLSYSSNAITVKVTPFSYKPT